VDVAGSVPLLDIVGGGESGEIGDSAVSNSSSGVAALQEVLRASPTNKTHRTISAPWF